LELSQKKELHSALPNLIKGAAHSVARRYRHYTTAADLSQELYAFVLSRTDQLNKELVEAESISNEEYKWQQRKISARLRRAAERAARKEKASMSGYLAADEYFYDTTQIAQLLPAALQFDNEGALLVEQLDDAPRAPKAPAEGGNLLAMVVDVRAAYDKLELDDQQLLEQRYGIAPMLLKDMAEAWKVSDSQVDRRIQSALRRLIDNLGGESPYQ
jgi:DNA-directed RNA polymerase specialized sigma subunit